MSSLQLGREAGIWEKSFVIVALLLFTNPFTALLPPEHDNNIAFVTFYSVYIITIFIVRNNIKDILILAGREKFLICLLVISIFSTIWSDFPLLTLRRSVGLIGTSLFGMYLVERYTLKEQLHMLGIMLGISAILSLLFALFLPSYGLSSDHEGAWQGIFDQKNTLGHIATISSVVFFLLYIDEKELRWIKLTLLILSLVLLVCSQSVTSIILLLVIFCLMLLYKSLQWNFYLRSILVFLYILLAVGTAIFISENQNFVLNLIGRDFTLTGRTELWESVVLMVKKRLLLGYGYNAFWIEGGSGEYIWYLVGWNTPNSHNGILDILLNVGLIGGCAYGLSFLQAFYNAMKYIKQENTWKALWPLVYLTSILLYNISESGPFTHNSIYLVLYVSTIMFFYRNNKTAG